MPLSRLAAVRSCALALILAGMTSLSLGANAPAAAPGATKDSKPAVTGLAADAVSAPAVPAGVSRVTSVEGIT